MPASFLFLYVFLVIVFVILHWTRRPGMRTENSEKQNKYQVEVRN